MLKTNSLRMHGALSSTAFFNKCIPLFGWVLGAQVTAGSLQLVSRSAGGHTVPEEKWMASHPLLFIAAYRANLPAAPPPDWPLCTPCHLHVPPRSGGYLGGAEQTAGETHSGELSQLEQHILALGCSQKTLCSCCSSPYFWCCLSGLSSCGRASMHCKHLSI